MLLVLLESTLLELVESFLVDDTVKILVAGSKKALFGIREGL